MKPSLLRRAHTVKTKTVWFGELEELGGDQYIVVSDTEENAKAQVVRVRPRARLRLSRARQDVR